MKSLKESIIRSNGADMMSTIKDIVRSPFTPKGKDQLNSIWVKLGLDLDGFYWKGTNLGTYIYIKEDKTIYLEKDKHKEIPFADRIILYAGNCYAGDILVPRERRRIGFTKHLAEAYCDGLIKKLNLEKIAVNESYFYLNFK